MALQSIQQKLNDSIVFLDGEPLNNPSDSVDQFIKQKKSRAKDVTTSIVHGSIYYLCVSSKKKHFSVRAYNWSEFSIEKDKIDDNERIVRYNGTAKYTGIICSKVWVASKQPIEDVAKFIKIDIMRSITGRLRMYTDAHHQSGQFNFVGEPPRRVFFKLKSLPIMFSDYLFRGESDDTIITQALAIMDLQLDKQDIVDDIETMSGKITKTKFLNSSFTKTTMCFQMKCIMTKIQLMFKNLVLQLKREIIVLCMLWVLFVRSEFCLFQLECMYC